MKSRLFAKVLATAHRYNVEVWSRIMSKLSASWLDSLISSSFRVYWFNFETFSCPLARQCECFYFQGVIFSILHFLDVVIVVCTISRKTENDDDEGDAHTTNSVYYASRRFYRFANISLMTSPDLSSLSLILLLLAANVLDKTRAPPLQYKHIGRSKLFCTCKKQQNKTLPKGSFYLSSLPSMADCRWKWTFCRTDAEKTA